VYKITLRNTEFKALRAKDDISNIEQPYCCTLHVWPLFGSFHSLKLNKIKLLFVTVTCSIEYGLRSSRVLAWNSYI